MYYITLLDYWNKSLAVYMKSFLIRRLKTDAFLNLIVLDGHIQMRISILYYTLYSFQKKNLSIDPSFVDNAFLYWEALLHQQATFQDS